MKIFLFGLLILISGCNGNSVNMIDAGNYISSSNGIVYTTKGHFTMNSSQTMSAFIDEKVFLRTNNIGYSYICVLTMPVCKALD